MDIWTTDIFWKVRPKYGWKIDDFPKAKEEFKGIPVSELEKYEIKIDDLDEYHKINTYGHSRSFLVSMENITYRTIVYRHGVKKNNEPYYILQLYSEFNDRLIELEQDEWDRIDAWCWFPVFKEFA